MIATIQDIAKDMADIVRGLEKRYQTTYNHLFGTVHQFYGESYTIIGLVVHTVGTKVNSTEQDGKYEIITRYEPTLILCKGLIDGPDRIREMPLKHFMTLTRMEQPWMFDITIESEVQK